MLSVFRNMFRIPDLRNKILFTLFIFALYRLGTAIPVPGVDLDQVQLFAEQSQQSGFVGILNLFSGGGLETMSVFALGIMPYITASIIMQLLAVVIPKLQALQDEGEAGRKVVTQWTRYVTVGLALIQSTGFTFLFHSGQFTGGIDLIPDYTLRNVLIIVMTMTAETALIMWLGELITDRGIGNGMSLIIFISIVEPAAVTARPAAGPVGHLPVRRRGRAHAVAHGGHHLRRPGPEAHPHLVSAGSGGARFSVVRAPTSRSR